jgi:hypothetical protein
MGESELFAKRALGAVIRGLNRGSSDHVHQSRQSGPIAPGKHIEPGMPGGRGAGAGAWCPRLLETAAPVVALWPVGRGLRVRFSPPTLGLLRHFRDAGYP